MLAVVVAALVTGPGGMSAARASATRFTGLTFSAGDVVAGTDGSIWFSERPSQVITGPDYAAPTQPFDGRIGRITPKGLLVEYPIALPGVGCVMPASCALFQFDPIRVAAARDGGVWFTEDGQFIGRVTRRGRVEQHRVGQCFVTAGVESCSPEQLGPLAVDDNDAVLFSVDEGGIGQLPGKHNWTDAGDVFAGTLHDLALGSNGALWFTQTTSHARSDMVFQRWSLGRIARDGVVTTASLPTQPEAISPDAHGGVSVLLRGSTRDWRLDVTHAWRRRVRPAAFSTRSTSCAAVRKALFGRDGPLALRYYHGARGPDGARWLPGSANDVIRYTSHGRSCPPKVIALRSP